MDKIITLPLLTEYDTLIKQYIQDYHNNNNFPSVEDELGYGVEWDFSQSSSTELTRIGNMNYHASLPIQSQMRGCVHKNGVVQYYLNPDDWRFKGVSDTVTCSAFISIASGYEGQLCLTFSSSSDPHFADKYLGTYIKVNGVIGKIIEKHSLDAPDLVTDITSITNEDLNEGTIEVEFGSVLDGTDGEVGVEVPEFYIWQRNVGTKHRVYISQYQVVPFAMKQPKCIVSAYRVTADRTSSDTIKLVSVCNTTTNFRGGNNSTTYDSYLNTDQFRTNLGKSTSNISRATARTYARNNNCELLGYKQYYNIFYWLYVIEYANFNSQAAYNADLTAEGYHQGGLGAGVTTINWNYWNYYNNNNPLIPCGYTNSLGNNTGVIEAQITMPTSSDGSSTTSYTVSIPRWRGLECPWGDNIINLDGIIFDRTGTGTDATVTAYIIDSPDNYTDSIEGLVYDRSYQFNISSNNYITDIIPNSFGDYIPSANSGGSATTYFADNIWNHQDNGNTSYPNTLLVGGAAYNSADAGVGSFYSRHVVSGSGLNVGFRTIKVLE